MPVDTRFDPNKFFKRILCVFWPHKSLWSTKLVCGAPNIRFSDHIEFRVFYRLLNASASEEERIWIILFRMRNVNFSLGLRSGDPRGQFHCFPSNQPISKPIRVSSVCFSMSVQRPVSNHPLCTLDVGVHNSMTIGFQSRGSGVLEFETKAINPSATWREAIMTRNYTAGQ